MSQGAPVSANLSDATQYYVGDQIGNAEVVFTGKATTTDVINLNEGENYHFAIYEHSSCHIYNHTPLTGSLTTCISPVILYFEESVICKNNSNFINSRIIIRKGPRNSV